MFIGTREEREIMLARERYWHDVASRNADYEELIQILEEQNALLEKYNALMKKRIALEETILNDRREEIVSFLEVRFHESFEALLDRLNEIDSFETLNELFKVSVSCESYDAFLEVLASYDAKS